MRSRTDASVTGANLKPGAEKPRALLPLRLVDVGGLTEENFRGFHYRFRERWMRVDAQPDVFGARAHLHGEHAFGNQFSSTRTNDADAKDTAGLRIEHEFGDAVGAVQGNRASRRCPG